MKKLMIALAAVAMAAGVQAATVDWTHSKDSAKAYDTIYLVSGADYTAVIAALDEGGANIAATMKNYDLINNGGASVQLNNKGGNSGTGTLGANPSKTDSFYYILVDTASMGQAIADGMAYSVTKAYTYQDFLNSKASVEGSDTPVPMELKGAFTAASGTIGSAVPEPTSGLLLLLGVAGLALKRKRA